MFFLFKGKPSKPVVSSSRSNPYVGETVTLTCSSSTNTVPETHSLSLVYIWEVDGVENPTDPRFTYSASRNTLTISGVTKTDATKSINCIARENINNGYTSDNSNNLLLDAQCK